MVHGGFLRKQSFSEPPRAISARGSAGTARRSLPWTWKQRSPRSRSARVIFLCANSLAGLLRARFGRNGEKVGALEEAEAEAAEPRRKKPRVNCKVEG